MIRVVHFIPSFGSGGAERQLSLVAGGQVQDDMEVHVAYCNGGHNLARLESSGVRLHAMETRGNYEPALVWTIFRLVRRLRPDVIQTWLPQMDILGGAAAVLNGVPLIMSERSSAAAYASGWKTRMRLMLGGRAACVVANSRGGIDYWRPHLPVDQLYLVRNCIAPTQDLADETADARESHLASQPVVLFAGRFSYEKNIPVLVEALILVARQQADVVIMMFGEGPERESAARRISAAGLSERIVVAGFSLRVAAWMAHAAVCVSVSHFEGHPNVVMEAAAAGCPLVLSDIAAHRELFDETSASLVPADSPLRIAEAVVETLHNPARARERAARASIIATQWDLPNAVAAYRSIYEEAVAAAG